jgi:A/G-specific adenine glycosylase
LKLSSHLINWYKENKRDLPWRNTTDPYAIWLSEIILQQTRVNQGLPYYYTFLQAYPTVFDLANASEQEVLTHWQGLGYYSRARNLHATAKYIANELNGIFPTEHKEILKLKGVGEYTAAAIASFAYNLPYPVIDGNVNRVIARLFDIRKPVDKPSGQEEIKLALNSIFDDSNPAVFNQAIMEFGATLCTPKKPLCQQCPLSDNCLALEQNQVEFLPIKEGKTKVLSIDFTYLIFTFNNKTYIEKRKAGIWTNLYQFPLIEESLKSSELLEKIASVVQNIPDNAEINFSFEKSHILSHRKINAHFYTIKCLQPPIFLKSNIFEIELSQLGTEYPTPVLIQHFLKHYKSND